MGLLLVAYGTLALSQTRSEGVVNSSLCLLWLFNPLNGSPTNFRVHDGQTLAQAQANLLLAPASAYHWAGLADAELDLEHVDTARYCMRQAIERAPSNDEILFHAANFYLRLEDYPAMFKAMSTVLNNPRLGYIYDRVFSLYGEMDMPLDELLSQGLPRNQTAANAFLHFWVKQKKTEEAQVTWKWIEQNKLESLAGAGEYAQLLAQTGNWDAANQVWRSVANGIDDRYQKTNWVFDGEFETTPVDCPFDWRFAAAKDKIEIVKDTGISFRRQASLRITDSPAAKAKPLVSQTVLLTPGLWTLSAMVKSRHVRTDQGFVLRLVDSVNPSNLNVSTEAFQGGDEWSPISVTAEVSPATHVASVQILSPKTHESETWFPRTIWIDSVTLEPRPKESVKLTGLTHTAQPCEGHGDCGNGESRLNQTAKQNN